MENHIVNNIILSRSLNFNLYDEKILQEIIKEEQEKEALASKINSVLTGNLKGYGAFIVKKSENLNVDPILATSIILVETGCLNNCSKLVQICNNVGGMKGTGCGSYAKFNSLEYGISTFLTNLAKNYYQKGLTTPKLMNKKYAQNENWHKDVIYYMNLIQAK